MATRTFRVSVSLTASQLNVEAIGSPLQPASGLKWTIVELRPFFQGRGLYKAKFDTELYHEIDQRDVLQYGKPHTVALDIVQPHKYEIRFDDESAFANAVGADIVVEESPLT